MSRPAAQVLQIAHVWRAQDLACATGKVVTSGHPRLDEQLPGGGWPLGSLIEVLQPGLQHHAWQLLLPALSQGLGSEKGPVVLIEPPFLPFGPSLGAQGLPVERLLRVQAGKPAARLWAAEQALRCADVPAVVAWFSKASANELRRLHMAAQQHAKLLFVFRPLQAAREASPAPLRLEVQGRDTLEVTLLKRRGPTLHEPLQLQAQPPRLQALLQARKSRGAGVRSDLPSDFPTNLPTTRSRSHVLDRTRAHA